MMIPVDTPAQPDAVIADTEPDSGGGDTDTTEEPSDDEISDAGSPSDIIADAEPADEQQEEQREEDEVRTRARCLRDSHRAARLCCARLCCDRLSPSLANLLSAGAARAERAGLHEHACQPARHRRLAFRRNFIFRRHACCYCTRRGPAQGDQRLPGLPPDHSEVFAGDV